MTIRAVLVDDEELARLELRSLLLEHADVEVVGEADHVDAAREVVKRAQPDVVMLDIEMPGDSGFSLLSDLDESVRVIFVTAYNNHAIRAFEVNALDYLLKPVTADRLGTALDRIRSGAPQPVERDDPLTLEDFVLVGSAEQSFFVPVHSLVSLQAAGAQTRLLLADGRGAVVNRSLRHWEQRLPPAQFCRIHRATIINVGFVDRIERGFHNERVVFLRGVDEPLPMSRRYAKSVRARFD